VRADSEANRVEMRGAAGKTTLRRREKRAYPSPTVDDATAVNCGFHIGRLYEHSIRAIGTPNGWYDTKAKTTTYVRGNDNCTVLHVRNAIILNNIR